MYVNSAFVLLMAHVVDGVAGGVGGGENVTGKTTLRITVRERKNESNVKMILIPPFLTLNALVEKATKALKVDPQSKIVFTNGSVFDDMQLLRDDDTLLLVPPSETKTSIDLARLGNRALEPDDAESERYQVAVMGPGGVGKSALTIRFCQNDFVEDYDPTIEDAYRHHFMVDSAPVTLDIMDTAGQAEYEALRQTWMKENQAFVLVFDITDPSTLKELRTDFYQKIYQMHEVDAPLIVVVGNKLDLDGKRKVSSKEAALIASQMVWKRNAQFLLLFQSPRYMNNESECAIYRSFSLVGNRSKVCLLYYC